MAEASIPLAKGFNPAKLEYPVYVSRKYDGVPVRIDLATADGLLCGVQSRSGKPVPSVEKLVDRFVAALQRAGVNLEAPMTFVAEVTHATLMDFKDVSGVVRKQEPQENLVLNFFDFTFQNDRGAAFSQRSKQLAQIVAAARGNADVPQEIRYVTQVRCEDELDLAAYLETAPSGPDIEGYIARSCNAAFKPNARHWDYQKIVNDPTVDLRITGFEEATSEAGEPLGMVGRVLADYHGEIIGVGPGKLTHAERKELWEEWTHWQGAIKSGYKDTQWRRIATVKYKRDDSYTALRQPTFQHWRDDKTEPSYE